MSAELRTAKLEDRLAVSKKMATLEWLAAPLTSVASWLQSLGTALNILQFSRFLMIIHWGFELIEFYMDLLMSVIDVLEATQRLRMSAVLKKVVMMAISDGIFDCGCQPIPEKSLL